jgi:threonine dehydrogenase-like Zn-dependent dehydrogenase
MRILRYASPRVAEIVEVDTPRPTGDQVLARSLHCSVSAGTEMGFYRGTAPQLDLVMEGTFNFARKPGNIGYPMRSDGPGVWWMGYSNIAEVVETGPDVTALKRGDIIFSRGGHKTHQLVSESAATRLTPASATEPYALTALVEIALNGVLDGQLALGETAVVSGLGTLGQLLLQMARRSGCRTIGVDNLENRLSLARKLSADLALDFTREDVAARVYAETSGRGADTVFEASGNEAALGNAIRMASYNGTIVVVSFYQAPSASLFMGREFHHKRTRLVASQIGGINPALSPTWSPGRRLATAIELVETLPVAPLVSHRVRFDELPEMLRLIDAHPSECSAVIVNY